MAQFQRQTAYKVWVSDLLSGKYVRQAGEWEPNYIEVGELKVSRVNLIASVIGNYKSDSGDYGFLELDDGSGVIRVKAWKEDVKLLDGIGIGDMVLVIGRVREINSDIYILGEIVRKIEKKEWANVRKTELKSRFGKSVRVDKTIVKEPVKEEVVEDASVSDRQKVLSIIEKNDEINVDGLISKSGLSSEEVDKIIKELLKEGEIYQPRAGVLKVV